MILDSKVPEGPIEQKWDQHRFDSKLVNPANKRKYTVIVVGSGLAGGSAAVDFATEPSPANGAEPVAPPEDPGAQAVDAVFAAAAAGRPFDLVLMDVHMPVMSGHAAVRALRERFDAETLPVIALTAAALTSERDEAMAAGMNDFLTKPIDVARLRETLARYLRRTAAA